MSGVFCFVCSVCRGDCSIDCRNRKSAASSWLLQVCRLSLTSCVCCTWQIALGCCLMALFSMCLWFVRVSIISRRRQAIFELELANAAPPVMTPDDLARLPVISFKASTCHAVFLAVRRKMPCGALDCAAVATRRPGRCGHAKRNVLCLFS
jgi:hypothetical protein